MNELPSLYTAIDNHPSGWKMGTHKHPHFEIAVVMLGCGAVYTEDRFYSIQQGDVILINPDVPDDFSSSTPISIAVLQVDPLSLELRQLFHQLTDDESLCLFPLAYYALEQYDKLFNIWVHTSSVRSTKLFNQFVSTCVAVLVVFIGMHRESGQPRHAGYHFRVYSFQYRQRHSDFRAGADDKYVRERISHLFQESLWPVSKAIFTTIPHVRSENDARMLESKYTANRPPTRVSQYPRLFCLVSEGDGGVAIPMAKGIKSATGVEVFFFIKTGSLFINTHQNYAGKISMRVNKRKRGAIDQDRNVRRAVM